MNPGFPGANPPPPPRRGKGDTLDLNAQRQQRAARPIPPTIDPDSGSAARAIPPTIDPDSGSAARAIPPTIDPDSESAGTIPPDSGTGSRLGVGIPPTLLDSRGPTSLDLPAVGDARSVAEDFTETKLEEDRVRPQAHAPPLEKTAENVPTIPRSLAPAPTPARAPTRTPTREDRSGIRPPSATDSESTWARAPTALKVAIGLSLATFATLGLLSVWIIHTRTQAYVQKAQAEASAASAEAEAEREASIAAQEKDVNGARSAATFSWERLQAAPPGSGKLQATLEAVRTARAWHDLAPDDAEAKRALFRAAMPLGDLAAESKQWGLAVQAYHQAEATDVNSRRARSHLAKAEKARLAELDKRRAKVLSILDAVSSQERRHDDGALRGAALQLSSYSDPQTADLLCERLEELTDRLANARRELLLTALYPTPEERRLRLGVLEGLEHALAAQAKVAAGERASLDSQDLIDAAQLRLSRRAKRAAEANAKSPTYEILLAWHQRDEIGMDLDVAWIICEALGHMSQRKRTVTALTRYLQEERDPGRATTAGIALCRIGGKEALTSVRSALEQHTDEAFSQPVLRALRTAEDDARRERGR